MSSINAVGSNPALYQPVATTATKLKDAATQKPNPVATAVSHDSDHDGDTDGPGLDVNG